MEVKRGREGEGREEGKGMGRKGEGREGREGEGRRFDPHFSLLSAAPAYNNKP